MNRIKSNQINVVFIYVSLVLHTRQTKHYNDKKLKQKTVSSTEAVKAVWLESIGQSSWKPMGSLVGSPVGVEDNDDFI